MAEFNIRSESVDVEQIMKQIRTRIREKRGVDYTEDQIRELATVRLEKFLDPKNLRSDLLEQFRKSRPALPEPPKEPPPAEPPFTIERNILFVTHRGSLRFIRKLLLPILKLFFNPFPLMEVLDKQATFNLDILKRDLRRKYEFQQQIAGFERSRGEWNVLYYEVLHNLVLETTRQSIEVKTLKMRLEALASRLDFSERRVRALEGVVQYRPEAVRRPERDRQPARQETPELESGAPPGAGEAVAPGTPAAPGEGNRRRRRRRRGRRGAGTQPGGAPAAQGEQQPAGPDTSENGDAQDAEADTDLGMDQSATEDEGFDEGGFDSDGDQSPDDREPEPDRSLNRSEDDEQ